MWLVTRNKVRLEKFLSCAPSSSFSDPHRWHLYQAFNQPFEWVAEISNKLKKNQDDSLKLPEPPLFSPVRRIICLEGSRYVGLSQP